MVVIKIFGVKEAIRIIREKGIDAVEKVEKAIDQETNKLQTEVMRSISNGINAARAFDTGFFMRGTMSETIGLTGRVYNEVEYGGYIEYGTSRMEARPHFRNTFFKLKPGIITAIKKSVI